MRRNRYIVCRLMVLALGASSIFIIVRKIPSGKNGCPSEKTTDYNLLERSYGVTKKFKNLIQEDRIYTTVVNGSFNLVQAGQIHVNHGNTHSVDINPHPFNYTIKPGICMPHMEGPYIVAFVHSAPSNVAKRQVIRETWANTSYHSNITLQVFFATGKSSKLSVQKALQEESEVYRDIMQEDYIDNYKNLTFKAIGSLRWILDNCHNTTFILKADDDVLVNTFALIKHLNDLSRAGQTSKVFICRVMPRNRVFRQGKWAIPIKLYPQTRYPPYCAGFGLVLSLDVARALYHASYHTPEFWVDDVWLTGIVAANANVKPMRANPKFIPNEHIWTGNFDDHWYHYWFFHFQKLRHVTKFKRLWAKLVVNGTHRIIQKKK